MSFTFRPAKREHTPLIVGIAGPTKSGKTYSAQLLARGLANGGPVAMLNAEGAKGHQYADEFDYLACDIEQPFRPERYTEAFKAALAINPAVVIVDSVSHMHNGPGGMLEYHEAEKKKMGGSDKVNFTAWIKPKAAENEFIYTLLGANCHVILCFRAKEKIKIVKGAEPIELGWQPIASESIPFETIFTLMLPPGSQGVPDLAISAMRKPFDTLIPKGQPLTEATGVKLREWADGASSAPAVHPPSDANIESLNHASDAQLKKLNVLVGTLRDAGHITTEHVWRAVGRDGQDMLAAVSDEDGELHWSPLRDSLSKDEASALIERLAALEERVAAETAA